VALTAHVILTLSGHPPENSVPPRSARQFAAFLGTAFVRGIVVFGPLIGVLTVLVGGSVLAYALFVANLPWAWTAAIALGVLLLVFVLGAYQLWSEAYGAALRFGPTWEHVQTRADTLRALVNEHDQRGAGFQRQYMAGHMTAARRDYDHAVAAGYRPDFDRERIGSADLAGVRELVAALDDVVRRWRADEDRQTGVARSG
jgi:hypothetical protein